MLNVCVHQLTKR